MAKSKFKRGFYNVVNTEKYIQPVDRTMNKHSIPEFRSSWERKFMKFCDSNPLILKWGTEPFAIQYLCPTDYKVHRYYIDGYIEFKSGDKFLVEIKPFAQTQPPKIPKRQTVKSTLRYNDEVKTFMKNQAKWEAARQFAAKNNLKFIILTEKELGV